MWFVFVVVDDGVEVVENQPAKWCSGVSTPGDF